VRYADEWCLMIKATRGSQTVRSRDSWCGSQDANESFSGWTKTFSDPRLCAAIADRLTFGGIIIETGIDSYRLAHTRQQLRHS
jgi:hypothetical protein